MSRTRETLAYLGAVALLVAAAAAGYYAALTRVGGGLAPADLAPPGDAALDSAIKLPPELKLAPGEPGEVYADTRGRRVVWMPLDRELTLLPKDAKSVWVWGSKPGTYRLCAWTAVGGLPTQNAVCLVQIVERPAAEREPAKPEGDPKH